jgi:hypothetical protein
VALTGLLALVAAANAAAQPVRQILVLQAVDRGNMSIDQFTGDFRVELDKRSEEPVNMVQIVLGPTGLAAASEHTVVDYIRAAFVDRPKPDLIMTVSGPAAAFARKYRQQIFPETPLLFASVDQQWLNDAPIGDNEIAVTVVNDFPRIVDDLLQVLPRTRQVFIVMGSGQISRFWHRELDDQFRRFHDRLTFTWFDNLSFPEIVRRCASLPDNSAIFYVTGAHLDSCTFAYHLSPEQLAKAVFAMKRARLGRLIVPAASFAVKDMPEVRRPVLESALRKLISLPRRRKKRK